MRLKTVCGKALFKSSHFSIKEAVEEAASENICLDRINLRKANLKGVRMDMAKMKDACFWGADLTGADMSDGDFSGVDFRTAILKEACFSDSTCHGAHFHGAYCAQMIIDGTDLSKARFSCPSIFSCDLNSAACLKDSIYSHLGEIDCALSDIPIVIKGFDKPIIIMRHDIIIGAQHQKMGACPSYQKEILDQLRRKIFYNHK